MGKTEKDLGLVYWDYYHADTRTYEKMLDIHAQLSDNVIFAGGSWIWNGISPIILRPMRVPKQLFLLVKIQYKRGALYSMDG